MGQKVLKCSVRTPCSVHTPKKESYFLLEDKKLPEEFLTENEKNLPNGAVRQFFLVAHEL